MPSVINATTTAGVAVTGDNSGALALLELLLAKLDELEACAKAADT